ncbi:MAG: DUF4260 domain-containing protein [Patescibacteria group bacterium]
MKNVLRLEYLLLAAVTAAIYINLGFDWYWLVILFLVFDISMFGYLINKEVGAVTYNAVHSVVGPILLLLGYVLFDGKVLLFIALLWFFHIAIDRTLGYGLKHFEGFHHTHLGKIGKAAK